MADPVAGYWVCNSSFEKKHSNKNVSFVFICNDCLLTDELNLCFSLRKNPFLTYSGSLSYFFALTRSFKWHPAFKTLDMQLTHLMRNA